MFLQTPWMRFTMERTLLPALWTDECCHKAAKLVKISYARTKMACNKQILIRCHEKLNHFSSEMLKRQNARSSKYQVHSARAHITVSSVYNGGRNMLRNAFLVLTKPQLQGIESILKVVWIFNYRNNFITRLYSCIIFVFLHYPNQ